MHLAVACYVCSFSFHLEWNQYLHHGFCYFPYFDQGCLSESDPADSPSGPAALPSGVFFSKFPPLLGFDGVLT